MANKLLQHLEIWADSGLQVKLMLDNGTVVVGALREFDRDEVVIEPVVDGQVRPITVVQVAHVAMATYSDDFVPDEDEATEEGVVATE
jgi:hypothetical protein